MPDTTTIHRSVLTLALVLISGCAGEQPLDEVTVPKTVDEDPTLESLELSTTRVHVREIGNPDADVIIVLHGGPGDDYRDMLKLADRAQGLSLADDHLLVFWDQRGTGLSRRHDPDQLTLDDYARDLQDIIDHYSPNAPVALLGHSWGGTYATMFLNQHPERVRAAALLEPGGLSSELRSDEHIAEQRALFDEFVNPYLGNAVHIGTKAQARADRALIETILAVNPDNVGPFARVGSLVLRELEFGALQRPFDFTTHLDQLNFEVLFFAGEDSAALGVAKQEQQRAAFPKSRLEVIAGADHDSLLLGHVEAVIPKLVEYFGDTEQF